ncbi:MAG TPA: GreA/GreB family elongation factor [Methylomirabilota bacterium]|nr:GreA/GreB family elongation factor [Methylomirabilota bacterium]
MREEFEKLAALGKITKNQVEQLVQLSQAGYAHHRSWGVGKVASIDATFSRITLDFPGKAAHSMDLGFAADSLKPLPADHILARKAADLKGLQEMAALRHLDVIKMTLQSLGGQATADQIQNILVPDVIKDDWKKWWDTAKREMKKDGHFQIPLKKSDPVVYQANEVALGDRLLTDFKAAKGLKLKIAAAGEALKSIADIANKEATVREMIAALNADIQSHQRTQPALALEGIFLRDELRQAAGLGADPNEASEKAIWSQHERPGTILEQISGAKQRRALQSFKDAFPANWDQTLLSWMNGVSTKLAGESALLLIQEGKLTQLKEHLARLISQHQASSELLLWLAKERSDAFADILGPEVFRAMLTAIERDQFAEKRSNKLRDYIVDDQQLLVELIGSADLEIIKDLTRALQLSPTFDDMDKRSLLARIVKSYPAVQALITGDGGKQESTLVVSWDSLERRREEYQELVQKKIPANSKEIAIARSYGDLRENHEYKAAKEMQKILMRRKSELEAQMVRARGTDFSGAKTDVVSIGTRVKLTDLNSGQAEQYAILGAWDYDQAKGIMSYLTPLSQALLNKKPGDEVDFELDSVRKRYRIDSIDLAAPASSQEATPAAQTP